MRGDKHHCECARVSGVVLPLGRMLNQQLKQQRTSQHVKNLHCVLIYEYLL